MNLVDSIRPVRVVAAGNVDDGKSTLLGRLLFETESIFHDQLYEEHQSTQTTNASIQLAYITDGLRDERARGITLDVCYRHFQTANRRFLLADAPGHTELTPNFATAASTADIMLLLFDAASDLTMQTKRHLRIASLFRIPHLIVAVNKMDAFEFSESLFCDRCSSIANYALSLNFSNINYVPTSGLCGDNLVSRSIRTPWYTGPTLLELLHQELNFPKYLSELRLPIQVVLNERNISSIIGGRVSSGTVKRGDAVCIYPGNKSAQIADILLGGSSAACGESVTIELSGAVGLSRGDIICSTSSKPETTSTFVSEILWMDDLPLIAGDHYIVRTSTNETSASIIQINSRLDIGTNSKDFPSSLYKNELANVTINTASPIALDLFDCFQNTGSFILINPKTFSTSGVGTVTNILPINEA